MESPQPMLTDEAKTDIHVLGRWIERHVEETWQSVLQTNKEKLLDAYTRAGDMAYGTYLNLLFRPIQRQMKQAGLRPEPPFPGDFDISREWGNKDETDQQRWMWSTISAENGALLGTIVTITFHDHTRFHVPRQPGVIALAETGKETVVAALSRRSTDFAQALEFTLEYEAYMRSKAGTAEPE